MPQRAPDQEIAKPGTSVRGAPAGAEVSVTMVGLLPFQQVRVAFGSLSAYEILGRGEADRDGRFESAFKIPQWAEIDRIHYWVVSVNQKRVLSDPFHVTAEDGTAHVSGTILTETTGCLAVQAEGQDKALYALQGETGIWTPGQHVLVTGTVADKAECGNGLPIAVREIQSI